MPTPSKSSPCVGIRTCSDYSSFGVELDGRTVSGGYRYGYQGSEKDNEFKGNGNSYTTEFRQLDPRLGRWLSVDPVIKIQLTPFNSMSNNPLNKIDPNGDDDYFNYDGTFSHSTSSGNKIYVLSRDKKHARLLTNVPLKSPQSRYIVENVIQYYAKQVGIVFEKGHSNTGKGFVKLKYNQRFKSINVPAYNSEKNIYININGGMNELLSDIYNLKSSLYHEKLHKMNLFTDYGLGHAELYFKQMQNQNFKKTTNEFKDAFVGGMLSELEKGMNQFDSEPEVRSFLTEFNKIGSKTLGYSIDFERYIMVNGKFHVEWKKRENKSQ